MNFSPSRTVNERHGMIGGSSLMHLRSDSIWGCRRQLAYKFLNYTASDESTYTDAMRLGHFYESELREWFAERFKVNCFEGEFIYNSELPFLGGHPDGLFNENGIIEIKTANYNSFNNLKFKGIYESYQDQLTLYMGITNRLNAYFVIGCSEDIQKRFMIKYEWDQDRYETILNNATDFVCAITKELPDRCGKLKKGLLDICRKCEFRTLCEPPSCRQLFIDMQYLPK